MENFKPRLTLQDLFPGQKLIPIMKADKIYSATQTSIPEITPNVIPGGAVGEVITQTSGSPSKGNNVLKWVGVFLLVAGFGVLLYLTLKPKEEKK